MNRTCLKTVALMLVLLPSLAWAGERPPSQVIIEGGLVGPYGQLGADFETTRLGLGAGDGFELGFRYRIHLTAALSVSPSFHFVNYADYEGLDTEGADFTVGSSSYRYMVEAMLMSEGTRGKPRPFLGLGLGLYRNRVQGFYQDFDTPLNESINTLGVSFRGGIQILGFEASLVYHVNRFNSWQLYRSDFRERYNWDAFGVRAAWIIPFGS